MKVTNPVLPLHPLLELGLALGLDVLVLGHNVHKLLAQGRVLACPKPSLH